MLLLKIHLVIAGLVVRDCFGSGAALRLDEDTRKGLLAGLRRLFEGKVVTVKDYGEGSGRLNEAVARLENDVIRYDDFGNLFRVYGCHERLKFCFKAIVYKAKEGQTVDEAVRAHGNWTERDIASDPASRDPPSSGKIRIHYLHDPASASGPTPLYSYSQYHNSLVSDFIIPIAMQDANLKFESVVGIEVAIYSSDKTSRVIVPPVLIHRVLPGEVIAAQQSLGNALESWFRSYRHLINTSWQGSKRLNEAVIPSKSPDGLIHYDVFDNALRLYGCHEKWDFCFTAVLYRGTEGQSADEAMRAYGDWTERAVAVASTLKVPLRRGTIRCSMPGYYCGSLASRGDLLFCIILWLPYDAVKLDESDYEIFKTLTLIRWE